MQKLLGLYPQTIVSDLYYSVIGRREKVFQKNNGKSRFSSVLSERENNGKSSFCDKMAEKPSFNPNKPIVK